MAIVFYILFSIGTVQIVQFVQLILTGEGNNVIKNAKVTKVLKSLSKVQLDYFSTLTLQSVSLYLNCK